MSTVQKFEDLKVWQKARQVNITIYEVTSFGNFSKDFALRDQIRKASISISSNIAEGFERNGTKEFHQFLSIAKASAAECRSQLYVAKDLNYIANEQFESILNRLMELGKMLSGLMSYLQTTEIRGNKFKEDKEIYGF